MIEPSIDQSVRSYQLTKVFLVIIQSPEHQVASVISSRLQNSKRCGTYYRCYSHYFPSRFVF